MENKELLKQTPPQTREIKVGNNYTGIYIGNTLVAGKEFDWNKLKDNLGTVYNSSFNEGYAFVVANLSSHNVNLYRNANNDLTVIKPGTIDWYTVGIRGEYFTLYELKNESGYPLREISMYYKQVDMYDNPTTEYKNRIINSGKTFTVNKSTSYKWHSHVRYLLIVDA